MITNNNLDHERRWNKLLKKHGYDWPNSDCKTKGCTTSFDDPFPSCNNDKCSIKDYFEWMDIFYEGNTDHREDILTGLEDGATAVSFDDETGKPILIKVKREKIMRHTEIKKRFLGLLSEQLKEIVLDHFKKKGLENYKSIMDNFELDKFPAIINTLTRDEVLSLLLIHDDNKGDVSYGQHCITYGLSKSVVRTMLSDRSSDREPKYKRVKTDK